MNARHLVLASCLFATTTLASAQQAAEAPIAAQQATTVARPGQAPRPPTATTVTPVAPEGRPTVVTTPRREGQPVNVKVDFTISDQRGGAAPVKRTLTLMVADERTGSIRTTSDVFQVGNVPLNVDASPTVLADGKVRLGFNLQYDWPAPYEANQNLSRGAVIKTTLHDSMSLILESGKSMIAAQSADPIGDRQVTVEVKATILR